MLFSRFPQQPCRDPLPVFRFRSVEELHFPFLLLFLFPPPFATSVAIPPHTRLAAHKRARETVVALGWG